MLPRLWKRLGWQDWQPVAAVVLAAAGFAVTGDAWQDILRHSMRDPEASHAFLVPIVAAWLVWVRRRRLRHCRPRPSYLGSALVLCGWALYSFGDTYLIQSFWHGGAVLLVVGCVLSVIGHSFL